MMLWWLGLTFLVLCVLQNDLRHGGEHLVSDRQQRPLHLLHGHGPAATQTLSRRCQRALGLSLTW